MYRLFYLVILSCTVWACSRPSGGPLSTNQVEKEVQEALESYFAATRDGGITAGFSFLDTSEHFFWVPPGYASAIGYDSVITVLTSAAPNIRSVDNQWLELTIHSLDNNFATFTGRIHSRTTDISGATSAVQLLETGVVVRRHDRWKLLCGQTRIVE